MRQSETPLKSRFNRWLVRFSAGMLIIGVGCFFYARTHPLVFNESFFEHAHCIMQVPLLNYVNDHQGRFPADTNGYGDALMLLMKGYSAPSYALTGPGYDSAVFDRALTNTKHVSEEQCGRVYVQGLTTNSAPDIAILFDKLSTPGGDHCHGFARLVAPLCREVLFVDWSHETVPMSDWPTFSKKQIELLVKEGFTRQQTEAIYANK